MTEFLKVENVPTAWLWFLQVKKSNLIQKVEIFGGGNFDERFQLTVTLKRIFGDVQRSQWRERLPKGHGDLQKSMIIDFFWKNMKNNWFYCFSKNRYLLIFFEKKTFIQMQVLLFFHLISSSKIRKLPSWSDSRSK